jgi:hypothetical protein
MLTTKDVGKPIAKTNKPNSIILSIVDPDIIKQKSKKRCCKWHNPEFCEEEPCCNKCDLYSSESDSEDENSDTEFHTQRGKKLIPLPDLTGRFVEYIAGPSGSGKSTIASGLAEEFRKVNPDAPIYMFSRTDAKNDPAFTKLKLIQIPIDESLLEDPIDITNEIEEEGALLIFDDCGTIHNDKLRKEVEKLMSDAMEVGRKLNCNMIITNHLIIPNEKKFARTVLNEMNMLTVFPKSGSAQQIRYVLKTYWGMNNQQIDNILSINSRWLRISKNYPQYVLWDEGARIL